VRVLVTGAAGFIGSAVARVLRSRGDTVTGIDNFSGYYEASLKRARLERLQQAPADGRFRFLPIDIAGRAEMEALFRTGGFDAVAHLAAQPGVRQSIDHPHAFVDSNLAGFLNVLEGCRRHGVGHLVYASSSSVYGANETMPYSVRDPADHPVSLYAATKKSNELMAHAYAHLFRIPSTGLRFFTVYGPWGRPDMAPMRFTRAILAGEAITLFNFGRHRRDFTYIDDVVEDFVRVLDRPATPNPAWSGRAPDPATSSAPWRVYNVGSHRPVELARFVGLLERALGVPARIEYMPQQPGDVPDTDADVQSLSRDIGFCPQTRIEDGVTRFVAWYRDYYGVPEERAVGG